MNLVVVVLALALLMFVAYRGFSVILLAPICGAARGAADRPGARAAGFQRRVHGQDGGLHQVLLSGIPARRGVRQGNRALGLCALDRHGGDRPGAGASAHAVHRAGLRARSPTAASSLFVVVFAVYPFAAEMFRQGRHSQAPHPRDHRARRVHLHDGRAAGYARRSRTSSRRRSSRPTRGQRRGWA